MFKNLINLDIDGYYSNWVLNKTNIFKYIHPNVLSITGLITDFCILFTIHYTYVFALGLCLFIRYSCDCLDGAVARKYNKVSDLGGILDTIADNTLLFILSFALMYILNLNLFFIPFLIVIFNLLYLWMNNSMIHHYNIKKYSNNLFHNIYRFGVNNNAILYSLFFIIYYMSLK